MRIHSNSLFQFVQQPGHILSNQLCYRSMILNGLLPRLRLPIFLILFQWKALRRRPNKQLGQLLVPVPDPLISLDRHTVCNNNLISIRKAGGRGLSPLGLPELRGTLFQQRNVSLHLAPSNTVPEHFFRRCSLQVWVQWWVMAEWKVGKARVK